VSDGVARLERGRARAVRQLFQAFGGEALEETRLGSEEFGDIHGAMLEEPCRDQQPNATAPAVALNPGNMNE
jgi:hypothetical protein